jgi:hypothetical protein
MCRCNRAARRTGSKSGGNRRDERQDLRQRRSGRLPSSPASSKTRPDPGSSKASLTLECRPLSTRRHRRRRTAPRGICRLNAQTHRVDSLRRHRAGARPRGGEEPGSFRSGHRSLWGAERDRDRCADRPRSVWYLIEAGRFLKPLVAAGGVTALAAKADDVEAIAPALPRGR